MPCNEIHGRRGCPNEFHVHLLPAGPQGPRGESNFNIAVRRLAPYLYDVSFDRIPDYIPTNPLAPVGCTSFVRNGALFTNLDWNYSETAEFFVHTKCFEGMAFDDHITDGNLDANSVRIGQLPYRIRDGRNENGIMVASHVLINDWGWHGVGERNVPIHTLAYHVLDEVQSMDELQIKMAPYLSNLVVPDSLEAAGYLMQFIVTDGTTTCVITPPTTSTGAYEILDISDNPKLANFRWVSKKTLTRNDPVLQLHPTGVERWNAIENNAALEDLRFTLAYEAPNRLSEFIGIDGTTKESSDEALITIYNRAHQAYLVRERDGLLWQTMHSVIYRPEWTVALCTQENYTRNHIQLVPTHLSELEDDEDHRTVTDEEKAFWNRGASGGIPEGGEAGMVLAKRSGRDFDLYWRIISGRLADMTDDATHRLVTDLEKAAWNAKADILDIPTALSELSPDELHRLVTDAQIEAWSAKADISDIPTALSQLIGDETHRLVTDTQIYIWNSKADVDDVPTRLEQLYGDAYHRLVTDTQIVEWNGKADASAITAHNVSTDAHSDIRASVEDVREIAMGKSSNFAFSIVDNPVLNSLDDDIVVTGALVDIFGVSHPISGWKVSDNALVVEMNLPDRWYAGNGHFYRLETAKSAVTDITFKGSTVLQNGVGVLPSSLSLFDDDATHRLVTDAQMSAWDAKADASDIPTALADLSDDATHRLVTDTQITAWNGKADASAVPYFVTNYQSDFDEVLAMFNAGRMVLYRTSSGSYPGLYYAHKVVGTNIWFYSLSRPYDHSISNGTFVQKFLIIMATENTTTGKIDMSSVIASDSIASSIIDQTLSSSATKLPSSSAVKTYVDNAVSGIPSAEKQAEWDAKADPSDIPTSLADLTDDTNHRTVSDTMIDGWNGKADKGVYNVNYSSPNYTEAVAAFDAGYLVLTQKEDLNTHTMIPYIATSKGNGILNFEPIGMLFYMDVDNGNTRVNKEQFVLTSQNTWTTSSYLRNLGISTTTITGTHYLLPTCGAVKTYVDSAVPSTEQQAAWNGKSRVFRTDAIWTTSSYSSKLLPNETFFTFSSTGYFNGNDGTQYGLNDLHAGDIIALRSIINQSGSWGATWDLFIVDSKKSNYANCTNMVDKCTNLSQLNPTDIAFADANTVKNYVDNAVSGIKPTYPLVSTLTGWNQAMHMGEATPNVTFPSPAASPTHEEEIRLTFIASSTNATFTAPSGCVLTDGTDYVSSIALTDLTVSCYYEVSAQVIGTDYSNNKVIALVVKKWAEMEE